MTATAGYYNEIDAIEGFDNFEMTDEVVRDHRTGSVHVRGGLLTATLQTPKGPAKLNLPGTGVDAGAVPGARAGGQHEQSAG